MISRVLSFAVHQRWLVVLLSLVAAAFGVYSLSRLPIDAVPDITNNQVQINTTAPSLSPQDVEKQVTYPIETVLAGTPGLEYTRSLSRNGFSQVTAVFGLAQHFNRRVGFVGRSPHLFDLRVGSINFGRVAPSLIDDMFAANGHLRDDGRMVHDMYLMRVKTSQESKGEWDVFSLVDTVPGDIAFRPLVDSKCPLLQR
jgi:AcrB/AcrD/AcrF family